MKKTREQTRQNEFVKYGMKEPVLLLTDPWVTLTASWDTHMKRRKEFGIWTLKNI